MELPSPNIVESVICCLHMCCRRISLNIHQIRLDSLGKSQTGFFRWIVAIKWTRDPEMSSQWRFYTDHPQHGGNRPPPSTLQQTKLLNLPSKLVSRTISCFESALFFFPLSQELGDLFFFLKNKLLIFKLKTKYKYCNIKHTDSKGGGRRNTRMDYREGKKWKIIPYINSCIFYHHKQQHQEITLSQYSKIYLLHKLNWTISGLCSVSSCIHVCQKFSSNSIKMIWFRSSPT